MQAKTGKLAPLAVADAAPVRDRAAKLLGLLDYSTRGNQPGALDDTLSVLLLSLMGEFTARSAAALLADGDGVVVRVAKGLGAGAQTGRRIPLEQPIDRPAAAAEVAAALGLDLVVPITHHTGTLGLIGLGPRVASSAYAADEREIVRLVGCIAGTAIASFHLYDQLHASKRTVERQLFDMHTLFDISRELTVSLDEESVHQVVAQTVMAHVLASRCVIVMEESGRARIAFSRGLSLTASELEVIAGVRFADAAGAVGRTGATPFDSLLGPHGIVHLLPMSGAGIVRGFIGIGARPGDRPLDRAESEFLSMLAHQALSALDNLRYHEDQARRERIERELSIAREIQQALLPAELPRIDGLELAAMSEPCYEIGGDYYDAMEIPGALLVAIGDVSGKSVPAALLMSILQATVRNLADRPGETPATLVATLNRHLERSTKSGKFVSFFLAAIDPMTGVVGYTNAGHNYPMVVRRDGGVERLETGGPVLGVFADVAYEQGSAHLDPGDLLFAFTDGVTEAVDRDDDEFGEDRLVQLLRDARPQGAHEAVRAVVAAVRGHVGDLLASDDLTILAVKRVEA